MFDLDGFDKRLLQLLQQNCRMTASELGEAVGLSTSAVQRRLTRLREEKIIEADVSIISPAVAGLGITCVVDIVLKEGHARALESFKTLMQQCSEVMQCYYVTGTYDFVLIVNAKDMQEYEAFTRKWLVDNPHLKHFYTHVVMERVKVGYSVPL
ncbi:MAG: Lrp/AsnC family transcriptional regulator [Chitinophagaceae bacterium]|nr:Lrp/AsnC family transcriptional regulator [Chitinophagaceae bacterium]